jgi:hypothetical protein
VINLVMGVGVQSYQLTDCCLLVANLRIDAIDLNDGLCEDEGADVLEECRIRLSRPLIGQPLSMHNF